MWKVKIGVTTLKKTGIVQLVWKNASMTKIVEVLNAQTIVLMKPMDIALGGRKANVCCPRNLTLVTENIKHASTKVSIYFKTEIMESLIR